MGWQSLGEGIASSIIGALILNFIFQNKDKKSKEKIKIRFPKDPFLIALSFAVFFGILSIFGFYYEWEKFAYIVTIDILFIAITIWINENQCPRCKKIFKKKRVHTERLKKWIEKYRYRDSKDFLYSDGTFKENVEYGPWKTRPERMEEKKDYFICKSCKYEWDSEPYLVNLDKHKRPKPKQVPTKIKNPNGVDFY